MASIAPSAAPEETPRVKGVASGLRSSPWKTTPAAASAPPTSTPASVRGRRATNRIWASTLSANGREGSSARRRLMRRRPDQRRRDDRCCREPAEAQNCRNELPPDRVAHDTRLSCVRSNRYDDQMTRCRVPAHLCLDAIQLAGRRMQSVPRSVGPDASTRPSFSNTRDVHKLAAKLRSWVESTIEIGMRSWSSRSSDAISS